LVFNHLKRGKEREIDSGKERGFPERGKKEGEASPSTLGKGVHVKGGRVEERGKNFLFGSY